MELFSTIALALTLGLTLGITIKKKFVFQNSPLNRSTNSASPSENSPGQNIEVSSYFDTLEIRFLTRLLDNDLKCLSVNEANEILRIEKLTKENQRQRRHLFLKDLNVKLKMLFGISECIERQSSDEDRRSKYYSIHHQLDKKLIENILKEKI